MAVPSFAGPQRPATVDRRLSRRRVLQLGAVAAAATAVAATAPLARAATPPPGALPWTVYMPATGHHVTRPFLAWWWQYGRESTLGWPVTEPLRSGSDTVQFFERGALQAAPLSRDPLGVTPLNLGERWLARRRAQADDASKPTYANDFFFPQTQRGVHPDLWPAFREGGGAFRFGYPLSWASRDRQGLTQVFQRAVLTSRAGAVTVQPIGAWEAALARQPSARAAQLDGVPTYDPAAFAPEFGPTSDRWADVDLTRQITTLFDGERPVYRALISTGLYPDFTPVGRYQIFARLERARLVSRGGTSKTYNLPDVQYIQYFTENWIGFHYAYWHDEFGIKRSAGCINMRLEDAKFTWDYCGQGTPVVVHD